MQEISIDNPLEMKVYVDDLPIKELIPKEQIDIFINSIELAVSDIIKEKEQRQNYYLKSKQNITNNPPP